MRKTIVLITGGESSLISGDMTLIKLAANSRIGFELTAQFLSRSSYHVIVTSHSPEKGRVAMDMLCSRNPTVSSEYIHLDVTDNQQRSRQTRHLGRQRRRVGHESSSSRTDATSLRYKRHRPCNLDRRTVAATSRIYVVAESHQHFQRRRLNLSPLGPAKPSLQFQGVARTVLG